MVTNLTTTKGNPTTTTTNKVNPTTTTTIKANPTTTISTPKSYNYIGCYASTDSCTQEVFTSGLSLNQMNNASSTYGLISYTRCPPDYGVYSNNMTVELCLKICTGFNFTYSGLE